MDNIKLYEQYNRVIDIKCVNYLVKHFHVTAFKHNERYNCAESRVVPVGNVTIDFTKTIDDLVSLYKFLS